MAIYIEYVIRDNVVMDYIIINFMEITIGKKFCRWNKTFVLIFGSLFALILPMLIKYKFLSFLYKITSSIVLTLCLQRSRKLKHYIINDLMFFAYTFFVGGVCLGIIEFMGIDYTMSSVVMYDFDFPVGIFGLILLLVIRLMKRVALATKNKIRQANYLYKIKLVDAEKSVEGYGLLDTGNGIRYKGEAVSIISIDLFLKLYKNINIKDILLVNIKDLKLKNWEYINIAGIGKSEKYLSFVLEYIEIDNMKINSPRFAIMLKTFGDYDIIISNDFIRSVQ